MLIASAWGLLKGLASTVFRLQGTDIGKMSGEVVGMVLPKEKERQDGEQESLVAQINIVPKTEEVQQFFSASERSVNARQLISLRRPAVGRPTLRLLLDLRLRAVERKLYANWDPAARAIYLQSD